MQNAIAGPSILDLLTEPHFRRRVQSRFVRFAVFYSCAAIVDGLYGQKKIRSEIPANVAAEVLYRNDHTCCICNVPRKHVQIHHINGDPSNNSPANLAVVCLDCHSLVTGAHGFGWHYSAGEVRNYKKAWEQVILYRRSQYKPPTRAVQRELIGQIDLMICQVLAVADDTRRKEFRNCLPG